MICKAHGGASIRPVCDAENTLCLLYSLSLEEAGKPVDFAVVPMSSLTAPDGGLLSAPGPAPEFTNAPGPMTFTPAGTPQTIELEWTDPTASRFSMFVALRPRGNPGKCYGFCGCGCRATRRIFDKLYSGTTVYQVVAAADPSVTSEYDLAWAPVSSTDPTVDPVEALTSPELAGAIDTLLVGEPIIVPVTMVGTPGAGGAGGGAGTGGTGTGGSGGGSCATKCDANGACGPCLSTADCCAGAVCISGRYCSKNSVATGCQCNLLSTSGVCADFAGNGFPQITSCGGVGTASCNSQLSWCCPGLVAVQNSGNSGLCQCEDPSSSSYECVGQ